ncbi:hypothetical protein BXT86_02255 [candidate division WOR-3 bacterium 4484_100]|uniref:Methyltransferase domain-containing protein n=1 Tax=candidate division WOR-3 bacterium 4484_100 TaxID=1936077 RepID=A0A1V4QHN6_UNCW3|nr:MAG: hypothetical protein BXT86_02255 [candidate division WOR-3 bacterium 4484_100]
MFVDKAELWLYWMNKKWKNAPRIARQIKKILKRYGISKGRVLELGCGNGRITIYLARQGFEATGVDISQLYIDDARKRADRMKVMAHFIRGDIRRIDRLVHRKFDVVISIWTSLGYYTRQTDEQIFKKVSKLLNKDGLFLVLNTMSREWLLKRFSPAFFEETDRYIKLNRNTFDRLHSVLHNKWMTYRKEGQDLIYEDEIEFDLRIYALCELVEMAEKAGLHLKEAYDSILTLEPAKSDSPANLVFQKCQV